MSFLSIEISDAGIMAAGGKPPRLLAVDGEKLESPGYALPEKKGVLLGKAAETKAYYYPHLIQNRFWDQLSTEPLNKAKKTAGSHAEIAFDHLAMIWEAAKPYGTEVMVTVPGFWDNHQLGIFLGIARELAMPVRGFVTQSVAAVPSALPGGTLLYINVHLHRTEVALLGQTGQLREERVLTGDELGLVHLSRIWVEAIAAEFVRTTRFDPLHDAATEQALYDRLPGVLAYLADHPMAPFEMRANHSIHTVTLNRELFADQAASYFEDVRSLIATLLKDKDLSRELPPLVLAHRFSRLPGVNAFLSAVGRPRTVVLEPGFSAVNVLKNIDLYGGSASGKDTDYFTSRPWPPVDEGIGNPAAGAPAVTPTRPTHLLYRDLAYPIAESPVCIGVTVPAASGTLQIGGPFESDDQRYCTIGLAENRVLLTVIRPGDTLVDNEPVDRETAVALGQSIRVGPSRETVRLIACLDRHET